MDGKKKINIGFSMKEKYMLVYGRHPEAMHNRCKTYLLKFLYKENILIIHYRTNKKKDLKYKISQ